MIKGLPDFPETKAESRKRCLANAAFARQTAKQMKSEGKEMGYLSWMDSYKFWRRASVIHKALS